MNTPLSSPQGPITPEMWREEYKKAKETADELCDILKKKYRDDYIDYYDVIVRTIYDDLIGKCETLETIGETIAYHVLIRSNPTMEIAPNIDLQGENSIIKQMQNWIDRLKDEANVEEIRKELNISLREAWPTQKSLVTSSIL